MSARDFHGSTGKAYTKGTHRLVSPGETLERVAPLLPIFGITRVANVTGLDRIGIPVAIAARPNSHSLAVSQGKGLDLAAAKASAVMEAVEAYHAENITRPLVFATFNQMRSKRSLVEPDKLPRPSLSPFHPNLRLLWIEAVDLLLDRAVWLPYELVHLDYTLPFPPGSGCFMTSSNGLASGNHFLEAVIHGICEVIERDANALWFARGAPARERSRIDTASIDNGEVRGILDRYVAAGVGVVLWETTSDIGVPSFYCTIHDRTREAWRGTGFASGSGCHPAREVAAARAMTEAAQSRLTMIAGSRDDTGRLQYQLSAHAAAQGAAAAAAMERQTPGRGWHDTPDFVGETLEADVEWLLERLSAIGVSTVAVTDLSVEGLGLDVVRVVIPGMEAPHDVPGYLPGARARRAAGQEQAGP